MFKKENLNDLHSGAMVVVGTRTSDSSAEPQHFIVTELQFLQALTMPQEWNVQLPAIISTLFFQIFKVFAVLSVTTASFKALLRR